MTKLAIATTLAEVPAHGNPKPQVEVPSFAREPDQVEVSILPQIFRFQVFLLSFCSLLHAVCLLLSSLVEANKLVGINLKPVRNKPCS
jgi:hypothetical protein